jgi:hypothetical protein
MNSVVNRTRWTENNSNSVLVHDKRCRSNRSKRQSSHRYSYSKNKNTKIEMLLQIPRECEPIKRSKNAGLYNDIIGVALKQSICRLLLSCPSYTEKKMSTIYNC